MNEREKVQEAIREILCRECDEQIYGSCNYKQGEKKYCEVDAAIYDILNLRYTNGNQVLGILAEEQPDTEVFTGGEFTGITGMARLKREHNWRKLVEED